MAWPGGKAWFQGLDIALEFSPTTAWTAAPTWVDITGQLQSISFTYGRQSSILSQPSAGTMTARLVDNTRTFDPTYASSPYTGGGLDPRRMIRLRARYATVEYTLGTWLINGWRQTSEVSNRLTMAEVTATDGFLPLSTAQVPISTGTIGTGDTIAGRIDRFLDYAGYPAGLRSLDADSPVVAPLDLTQPHAILSSIQEAAAADFGIFFSDQNMNAVYRGHRWGINNNLTALATLGGDGGSGELPLLPFDRDYADSQILNHVKATTANGEIAEYTDTASDAQFGPAYRDLGTVQIVNRNVLQNTVEWLVNTSARPIFSGKQVSLLPLGTPTTILPIVLAAYMGTRFTLNRRPNNVGSVATLDTIVEGGGMSLDVRGQMQVDYWLSQAPTPAAGGTYWRAGFGKWTTGSPSAIWA